MNAQVQLSDELPPYPEVHEIQVESALNVISRFRGYIRGSNTDEILAYEYKAAETLPVFEIVLKKLLSWQGDLLSLPNADDLIKSLSSYINDIELIMSMKKEKANAIASN